MLLNLPLATSRPRPKVGFDFDGLMAHVPIMHELNPLFESKGVHDRVVQPFQFTASRRTASRKCFASTHKDNNTIDVLCPSWQLCLPPSRAERSSHGGPGVECFRHYALRCSRFNIFGCTVRIMDLQFVNVVPTGT